MRMSKLKLMSNPKIKTIVRANEQYKENEAIVSRYFVLCSYLFMRLCNFV
jgi:hypothetical protein